MGFLIVCEQWWNNSAENNLPYSLQRIQWDSIIKRMRERTYKHLNMLPALMLWYAMTRSKSAFSWWWLWSFGWFCPTYQPSDTETDQCPIMSHPMRAAVWIVSAKSDVITVYAISTLSMQLACMSFLQHSLKRQTTPFDCRQAIKDMQPVFRLSYTKFLWTSLSIKPMPLFLNGTRLSNCLRDWEKEEGRKRKEKKGRVRASRCAVLAARARALPRARYARAAARARTR